MVRTVGVLSLISLLVLRSVYPVEAQQKSRPVIGFLFPGSLSYGKPNIEAFRQGLRELGYIEGKTITVEYRVAEGQPEQYAKLARELINSNVDVIVTASTPAIQAVKKLTRRIPIVMAAAADPVGTGLVASLAHPGGNLTGLSMRSPEVSGKRLELLKEIAPSTRRVGVLLTQGNMASENNLADMQAAAKILGLELYSARIEGAEDLRRGFSELMTNAIQAFTVFRESLLLVNMKELLEFARRNRLPAVYDGREFALAGGLMSYTPNHLDLYRRAASYVDRILKGAKPGDLPVEQAMRAEFIVNLNAANDIGLAIPLHVLQRADQVIR